MDQGLLERAATFAHLLVADVERPELDKLDDAHLVKVLRVRDGAPLSVTDGAGRWRLAEWRRAAIDATGPVVSEDAPAPLAIAVTPLKGDRTELMVQKATELGIDRVLIVGDAERAVVRWNAERATKNLTRLNRIAREALMQSRRIWLPRVETIRLREVFEGGAAIAHFDGNEIDGSHDCVVIGPEGGWTASELDLAPRRVTLGRTVLRAETAAITASSLLARARRVSA